MIQGQGDSTEFKERGLSAAFWVNLTIFQRGFGQAGRFRYFHFDLNAGGGFNEQAGCIGSPLAFLQATRSANCERFFAGFVDIDKAKVRSLLARPELQRPDCFMFHGDNRGFIGQIPDLIRAYGENPRQAIGTVLSDPNGIEVPLEELAWLSGECPKLDLVINWNSTSVKRTMGVFGRGTRLTDALPVLRKKHWLIRMPLTIHQFTLLIGRNIPTGEHRRLGLYHLNSPPGVSILNRCSYTAEERKGGSQPPLF